SQDATRVVRCCKASSNILSCYNGQVRIFTLDPIGRENGPDQNHTGDERQNDRPGSASIAGKDEGRDAKYSYPEGGRGGDGILVSSSQLQMTIKPKWLHRQGAGFVPGHFQIGCAFRMTRIQGQRPLIIQNRSPEVIRS